MEIKKDLCANAIRKVALLITKASKLGMDISGYGEAAENQSNGNVYLWLENYPFTLFIDLGSDDIQACWTNYNDDDQEEFIDVDSMTLYQLEEWCENNEKIAAAA
jgi:hypothetical protein